MPGEWKQHPVFQGADEHCMKLLLWSRAFLRMPNTIEIETGGQLQPEPSPDSAEGALGLKPGLRSLGLL